jgi:hypothetical protein
MEGPGREAAEDLRDPEVPVASYAMSVWDHGGPIIEREDTHHSRRRGRERWRECTGHTPSPMPRPDTSDRAMRACVASKFGEEVELP